jgi:dehydrogenase/reductase SDR family protein 12
MRPNEELKSGAFYFDRAEAEKHLKFGGTSYSVEEVDSIAKRIRSLCKL